MFDHNLQIWLNGELKTLADSSVSPLSHTLHYGSGAFEGIRAYETTDGKTQIFRLDEHIDRLFYSAEAIHLTIPYTKEELITASEEVLQANNLQSAYIRPLVYFNDKTLGVNPDGNDTQVLIAAWSWGQYLADAVSAEVSDYRRISEKSTICDAKVSGHYVNSILATSIAKKNGYLEAILLDHNDHIAEGPGENIFFIKDNELHTPKLGKILAGITRDAIITMAPDLGYKVIERDISLSELKDFDSAFFTGTAAEVSPIDKIDQAGQNLQTFDLKPANELKAYFFDIVYGQNDKYRDWLHFVN